MPGKRDLIKGINNCSKFYFISKKNILLAIFFTKSTKKKLQDVLFYLPPSLRRLIFSLSLPYFLNRAPTSHG